MIATPNPATSDPPAARGAWARGAWFPLAVVAVLAVHLAWLTHFPPLHPDEGQDINWLLAWWHGTWASTSMDRLGFPVPFLNYGLWGLSVVIGLDTFGVELAQARLVSLGWGVALLGVTYWLGRLLYSTAEARAATLILALSYPFLLSAHLVRVDIALATVGLASAACMLYGRRRAWANVAAGLLLVLGEELHPNVGAYWVGVGLLYLVTYRVGIWRSKEAWLFVGGLVLGGLLVLGPLSFGLLEAKREALGFYVSATKQPPIFVMSLPQALVGELVLRGSALFWPGPMDMLLLLAALVWALGHRERGDRPLLWLGFAIFVFFVLFVRTKSPFYLIEGYPIVALLAASALCQVAVAARGERWRPLFAALVGLACLALGANRALFQVLPSRDYDHGELGLALRRVIPAGASVLGEPGYWLELRDHPYYNWWEFSTLYQRDGIETRAAIRRYRPDAIITDSSVTAFFLGSPPPRPLLESAFWRPIMEPVYFPSPYSGTLAEALGDDYTLAFEGDFDGPGHVTVYLRKPGR